MVSSGFSVSAAATMACHSAWAFCAAPHGQRSINDKHSQGSTASGTRASVHPHVRFCGDECDSHHVFVMISKDVGRVNCSFSEDSTAYQP